MSAFLVAGSVVMMVGSGARELAESLAPAPPSTLVGTYTYKLIDE